MRTAGRGREYERRWWTLGVLCLSLVMIVVANASLNVALPTLVKDLHASASWPAVDRRRLQPGVRRPAADRRRASATATGGAWRSTSVWSSSASASAAGRRSPARRPADRWPAPPMGIGAALVMPATLSVLAHVFPPDERPPGHRHLGRLRRRRRRARAASPAAGCCSTSGGARSSSPTSPSSSSPWSPAPSSSRPRGRARARRSTRVGALLSIAGLGALIYAIIEAPVHGVGCRRADAGRLRRRRRRPGRLRPLGAADRRAHARPALLPQPPLHRGERRRITLIFFVMFGMIFVLTQYLQSVLGYSPLQAGVRMLPVGRRVHGGGAPVGPLGRALRPAVRGRRRALVRRRGGPGAALAAAATHANYPLLALVARRHRGRHGHGHRTVDRRHRGRRFPLNKAGVGSAVNDTTRELGGALGVAVFGSVLASLYRVDVAGRLAGLPAVAPRRRHQFAGRRPPDCRHACRRPPARHSWRRRPTGVRARLRP